MYNKERYKFFLEAPSEIADHCCSIMKKSPMYSYAKRTGKMPMTAQMASVSRLRTTNWLKNGCNGFNMTAIRRYFGRSRMYWNIYSTAISRLRMCTERSQQILGKRSHRVIQWIWGYLMLENPFLTLRDVTGQGAFFAAFNICASNKLLLCLALFTPAPASFL